MHYDGWMPCKCMRGTQPQSLCTAAFADVRSASYAVCLACPELHTESRNSQGMLPWNLLHNKLSDLKAKARA